MINASLAVALGGAIGAVLRHGVNVGTARWLGTGFPYGTLCVNIAGSFMIGLLIALFAHIWQPPQTVRLFLVTGILGGFTTFSTFSLDTVVLLQRQDYMMAGLYMAVSVVLSVLALFGGLALVRSLVL